jgi:hypothetical protein
MQQLLTSIYAAYNSDTDLKAALPGGMYLELAPQASTMTYGVYQVITGRPDYMLAGEYYEILLVQFDIYAATNSLRLAAYDKLLAVYDDARLTATGYTPVVMERVNQQMVRDGAQNEIFRAIVEYSATWKKT